MSHLRILTAAAALMLAACGSTIESRISGYPEKFARLPDAHQELVRQGRIKEGMNKDAVYLAWGAPNSVRRGSEDGEAFESWRFIGHYPVWTDNYGYGYGYGYGSHWGHPYHHHHYDIGPSVAYVPYNAAEVIFLNDRVNRWERQR